MVDDTSTANEAERDLKAENERLKAAAARVEQLEREQKETAVAAESAQEDTRQFAADTAAEALSEADRVVAEQRAEAEKWRALAEKHQREAAENQAAAVRVAELERSGEESAGKAAAKIAEAEQLAEQAKAEAVDSASADVDDWKAEADRWKQASRRFEKAAESNRAAQARLEKLEADLAAREERDAGDQSDLEQRADEAELRALKYEIAQEHDIDLKFLPFLTGATKKEIEESADALLAAVDVSAAPEGADEHERQDEETVAAQQAEADRVAELEARAAEAEARARRFEVAAAKGLPQDLVRFITASDPNDIESQVDTLLSANSRLQEQAVDDIGTRRRLRPRERLRTGAVPDVEPEPSIAELAQRVRRKRRGF